MIRLESARTNSPNSFLLPALDPGRPWAASYIYGVVLLVGAPPKKGSGEFSILKVRVKVQIGIDFGTMLARAKSCTSKHRTEINFDLNFDMKTFKMKILLSSFWGEGAPNNKT